MKKIYVGNLSFNSTEEQIRGLFAQYGNVSSVTLVTDRDTGQAHGFGFVDRQSPPYLGGFRQKPEHASDIKAVVAWLRGNTKCQSGL